MSVSEPLHYFKKFSIYAAVSLFYFFYWFLSVYTRGNITALVGFGCYSPEICFAEKNSDLMPEGSYVYGTGGYDGQFYYYIAAGWLYGKEVFLDSDPFRLSRIGYPLLLAPAYVFGPRALVLWMSLSLFLFHLLSIVILKNFLSDEDLNFRLKNGILRLYGLNPFTLQSFLLNVSDGLALSLSVIIIIIYYKIIKAENAYAAARSSLRDFTLFRFSQRLLLWLIASYMLLVKETFLAVPLAFAAASFFSAFSPLHSNHKKYFLMESLFWISSMIPVLIWWHFTGFSPLTAAERGSLPFAGYIGYLHNSDALFSGRGILSVLLPLLMVMLFYYTYNLYKNYNINSFIKNHLHSVLILILAASLLLVSSATDHEYWGNYANAVRLFNPGIMPMLLLPSLADRGRKFTAVIMLLFFVHNLWIVKDIIP